MAQEQLGDLLQELLREVDDVQETLDVEMGDLEPGKEERMKKYEHYVKRIESARQRLHGRFLRELQDTEEIPFVEGKRQEGLEYVEEVLLATLHSCLRIPERQWHVAITLESTHENNT